MPRFNAAAYGYRMTEQLRMMQHFNTGVAIINIAMQYRALAHENHLLICRYSNIITCYYGNVTH